MIIMSFRTKKDKEHMLKKAKEMEAYAMELVDCLEEAISNGEYEEDEDYDYSERNMRNMRNMRDGGGSMGMRSRYEYRRR